MNDGLKNEEIQSVSTVPKKELLSNGLYEGILVQIYEQEFEAKNGSKFKKYMYEVLINEKIVKGNTYTHYLEKDMEKLKIKSIQHILGKSVRALVTSATIETEKDGVVDFNKIKRMWLTVPAEKE